ncbi:hypothetical protein A9Q73_10040 [Bermanella sp. 47_1433_sub80_T6]|nr:hypothetical protein A9Q73_10040 [Bermanella sp. 47_1433_sub80_T6]
MNFKVLSVAALVISSFCFSAGSVAEKMPESPKQIELNIENTVNALFKSAIIAAAKDLNEDKTMRPFALVKKVDGTIGFFQADETDKNEDYSVMQQAASIRKLLIELAVNNQIVSSAQVMYTRALVEGKEPVQGLSFEIEHIKGLSLMRFMPVTKELDENGTWNKKLRFQIESTSTTKKPQVVFAYNRQ